MASLARLRALLVALLCSPCVGAGIFYVSSSKGSDASSGTSPSSAWKTLPHAVAGVPKGGSLLLRMGDSWGLSEPITLSAWGSGVSDGSIEPAVLGAYTDGQDPATTARPSVVGAGVGPVLYCADCVGFVVDGVEVSGGEQGILFSYSAAAAGWGGVTVTNSFIHDIRGVRSGGNPMAWGSGIGFNTTASTGAWGCGGLSQVDLSAVLFGSGLADVYASNVSITGNIFNASDVAYQNCITAQVRRSSFAYASSDCRLYAQGTTVGTSLCRPMGSAYGPTEALVEDTLIWMASLGQATF